MAQTKFKMGRLDHVHIRVPDRALAAQWYSENLGFEAVEKYAFWATEVEGGPLQISADGGKTMLALFEASSGHPMVPQTTGIAFSVDADSFVSFARSLPNGNNFELNCYDYDRIRQDLIQADGIDPVRYWPLSQFERYKK